MSLELYLIDTDISLGTPCAEIDDGAALIVLRRALGERVLAITTVHGNVTVEEAAWNAQRLCAYLDWDIPVHRGAARPLVEDPAWFDGWRAGYGPTPPWPDASGAGSISPNPGVSAAPPPLRPAIPTEEDAAGAIVRRVRAHPGRVTLVALGPLTNLADALGRAPEIAGLVREVVCMGGGPGEEAPEFNFRCDPEAAQIVLSAGWPVRLFGLEITRRLFFTRGEFETLPDGDPALALLKAQAPGWIDRVEGQGWEAGGCSLHDAAPVAALIEEGLFTYREAVVSVELADPPRRGMTTIDAKRQIGGRSGLVPARNGPPLHRVADGIRSAEAVRLVRDILKADERTQITSGEPKARRAPPSLQP